ncbi:MAG: ribosomal protein methylthiotransferase accessory factor [Patescibacteria group bacterium]|nr:ribosomal protein methylthiotransferase accessory factor [Patescibacteria group bacterium]
MKKIDTDILSLIDITQENNLVGRIEKDFYKYNDDPSFFSYLIQPKDNSFLNFIDSKSSSEFRRYSSFNKKKCIAKMFGEIIERACSSRYNEEELIWDNYENIKSKAVDPSTFMFFEKRSNINYYKNHKQKLNWIKSSLIGSKKDIFVPAQLVYLLYKYKKNEPIVSIPISTGTALYSSKKKAVLTGLLEVIERDAFMVRYLTKMKSNLIDDKKLEDTDIKKIIKEIKYYNLDIKLVDINLDAPSYSILAILLDKTEIGPAISVGMKSDICLKDAILGAMEECFQVRPWIRSMMVLQKKAGKLYGKEEKLNRGLLWSDKKMIKNLRFFLEGNKIVKKENKYKETDILEWSIDKNIFYKDISLPILKNKFFATKVLSSYFQPLFLDERYPIINHKRISQFASNYKINKIPHPFL